MADVEMNGLSFQMVADTSQARQSINSLSRTLERLRTAAGGAASSEQQFSGAVRDSSTSVRTQQKEVEETTRKVEILKNSLSRLGSGLGHMGNGFRSLGGAIVSGGSALRGFTSFTARITGMKAMGSAISGITGKLHGMFSGLLRIAKFRLFRTIIKEITKGFIDGTKNVYAYSQAVGTSFAPAMDRIATSTNYLKNSLGAMAAPLLEALAPALEFIIDKFVDFLNIVNQVIAKLNGKEFTTVAKKVATKWQDATDDTKNSIDKLKKSILGFDELNVLTDNTKNNGTGKKGDDNNASISFEEIKIDSKIGDVVSEIKSKIEKGDWAGAGATLATKINELFDPKKFTKVGTNLGTIINNGINFANGFIKTLDTEKIGASLAGFLRGAIKTIDWKLLGQTLVTILWKGLQFTWGLIKNFPAAETAKAISDFVISAFNTMAEFIGGTDWVEVGKTCNEKLMEFLSNLDWEGIWTSVWRVIAEAFGATVGFTAGVTESVWNGITDWWDKEIVNNPDGESMGKNLWDAIVGWFDKFAGGVGGAFINSSWYTDMYNDAIDSVVEDKTANQKLKDYWKELRQTFNEEGWLGGAGFAWDKGMEGFDIIFTNLGKSISTFFTNIGTTISDWFTGIRDKIVTGWEALWIGFHQVWDPVAQWFIDTFDSIKQWFDDTFGPIGQWFVDTFNTATDTIGGFIDNFKERWDVIKEKIDAAKDWFSLLWLKITYLFGKVGTWFKEKFDAAAQKIKEKFIDPAKEMFSKVWSKIKEIFSPVVTWFKDKFKSAKEKIQEVFENISTWFKKKFDAARTAIEDAFKDIKKFFKKIWEGEDGKGGIAGVFREVGTWFGNRFTEAYDAVTGAFRGIVKFFKNLWDDGEGGGIKGVFTDIGTKVGTAVSNAFKTVINGALTAVENTINGGIRLINKFIGWLNEVAPIGGDLAELEEIKFGRLSDGGTITHKHIQEFAGGGFPSHGTMFVAGENGSEIVGNIGNRTEVMNRFQIADVMYNSVLSAMKSVTDAITRTVATAANAIVSANLYVADITTETLDATYDSAKVRENDDVKMYEAVRMGVSDATARQNDILREQNELLRQLLAKDNTAVVTTDSIISGLAANNKRVGRQVVPVNL